MLSIATNQLFRSEIEIKKSQFICSLKHTDTEIAARKFINQIRSEFPDARHHCTAFKIADRNTNLICRSSDDGEPAGTAGMPMLEALGENMNICVVVTRYFGGIKLGTGGLVRAYSEAVKNGLEKAKRVQISNFPSYWLELSITQAARLEGLLISNGYEVLDRHWESRANIQLLHRNKSKTEIEAELSNWLSAPITVENAPEKLYEIPI